MKRLANNNTGNFEINFNDFIGKNVSNIYVNEINDINDENMFLMSDLTIVKIQPDNNGLEIYLKDKNDKEYYSYFEVFDLSISVQANKAYATQISIDGESII